MAEMFPKILPGHILRDPRRSAEVKVFNAFQDSNLPNSWKVFYSGPWWAIDSRGAEIDGECDFIVAEESKGILFIEVKGGRVSYDSEMSQWRTIDRYGNPNKIKNPIEQAKGSKHEIIKKLQGNKLLWPNGHVNIRHGAILPDTMPSTTGFVGPHEAELFAFSRDMPAPAFRAWVEGRMGKPSSEHLALGNEGISAIKLIYGSPIELSLTLSTKVEHFEADTVGLLTGAQLQTIVQLPEHARAIVRGGAGTGKTLLAQEYAIRMAAQGKRVLMLCNNRTLYSAMASKLERNLGLDVYAFDDIFDNNSTSNSSSKEWDLVVLDEAQDIDFLWWERIVKLVAPNGNLLALADSNQSLYQSTWDLATELGAVEFMLRLNLRNSKEIADSTKFLYKGPPVDSVGPEGGSPVVIQSEQSQSHVSAAKLANSLIVDEGLYPDQLAVLFESQSEVDNFILTLDELGIKSKSGGTIASSKVTVDTVINFKGLEAPVVIIVANASLERDMKSCYVAISRARMRLYVVGAKEGTLLYDAISSVT